MLDYKNPCFLFSFFFFFFYSQKLPLLLDTGLFRLCRSMHRTSFLPSSYVHTNVYSFFFIICELFVRNCIIVTCVCLFLAIIGPRAVMKAVVLTVHRQIKRIFAYSKINLDWEKIWSFWLRCQNYAMLLFWLGIPENPYAQSRQF